MATQKGNKNRLILDLKYVNRHVYKDKVNFDDWKIMLEFIYMYIKQGLRSRSRQGTPKVPGLQLGRQWRKKIFCCHSSAVWLNLELHSFLQKL